MRTYKFRYTVESGSFSENECSSKQGVCDKILLASAISGLDGKITTQWMSRGGLTPDEQFMQWYVLAEILSREKRLSPRFREFCREVASRLVFVPKGKDEKEA